MVRLWAAARRGGIGRALCVAALCVATLSSPRPALAQALGSAGAATPPDTEVVVVAPTPLSGSTVVQDLVPANTVVLTCGELTRTGAASVLRGLSERIGAVTLDDAQGDPLQPNLLYRGFEASPLAGDGQGLAVYVGGVRFNQPFGDTVDWDLIPDMAVDRMDLMGSNPAFGLNALGGALSVRLKDGFGDQGGKVELSGGSFGRVQGGIEEARQVGRTALYIAVQGFHERGWRDHSPSTAGQVFADLGWKPDRAELHLNLLAADTDLTGNGVAPVELLAVDRNAVFTYPDVTKNRFWRLAGSADLYLTAATSVQASVYYGQLGQHTLNSDAAQAAPCASAPALVCGPDGAVLTDANANPIANFVTGSPFVQQFPQFAAGGPYSFLNVTRLKADSYGVSAQVTNASPIGALSNHLVVGASYDGARTAFAASTLIGALSLDRGFVGPGIEIDLADGSVAPVGVIARNDYYGAFFSDTLNLTGALSATLSGRYNAANVALDDQLGTRLNGRHSFDRFNPAAGLAYRITPDLTAYAGYAEANRAPTPAELSCASPLAPCSLTNFFVGDPDLRQVVAHTLEAGLRGRLTAGSARVSWHAGLFRTASDDDIQFVASPTIGRDFFTNVGQTLRQGVEAGFEVDAGALSGFVDYAYTDATFRTDLVLDGGDNPQADANGLIHVHPGDRLPGVARHSLKFGAEYQATRAWRLGFTGRYVSGQYLFGDEANQNPQIPGYVVVNADTTYQLTPRLQLFARLENLAGAKYATYGVFSPVTSVPILQAPGAADPRSLSPGPPTAGFAGLRLRF
jgi:iron complex outermembrane receptor protein